MTVGTTGYTPEFVKKNEEIMTKRLVEEFGKLGIPEDEIREAAHAGWLEKARLLSNMMTTERLSVSIQSLFLHNMMTLSNRKMTLKLLN